MAERLPDDDATTWTDAALVAAMRREERAALAEFYARFAPLLRRCARLWGVPPAERETAVDDVLADVALALMRHTRPVPRSLAAYLATSFRHHLGTDHRRDERRRRRVSELCEPGDADGASVGAAAADAGAARALCSDHARRSARGLDAAPGAPSAALAALARHLESRLSDDDRLLLAWLAHHVPLRTAAAWLGVSYESVSKRAQRLRARMRAASLMYVDALPAAERREVERVLARGDAAAPAASAAIIPPPSTQEHP
jgi:DNA-directed RNA polymerase specialized sigma24 family protein